MDFAVPYDETRKQSIPLSTFVGLAAKIIVNC